MLLSVRLLLLQVIFIEKVNATYLPCCNRSNGMMLVFSEGYHSSILKTDCMKKERFDFIAMLISLFLLSAFVIENQISGTIAGSTPSDKNAGRVGVLNEQKNMKGNIIHSGLLIDGNSPFKNKTALDLKVKNAEAKDGAEIQQEQR